MYAIDFEYDGTKLSEFGFIICSFDNNSGVEVSSIGSEITFNTVSRNHGTKFSLTSTRYDNCINTSFDICKNPELFDDMVISDVEFRNLVRWLNRRKFLQFSALDETLSQIRYYNASFNISKITIGGILYGLKLDMTTDKPFGYSEKQNYILDFDDSTKEIILVDTSDEAGYIYPDITIECRTSGDLLIRNSITKCTMMIKNCSIGEIITIDGDTMAISSSFETHDICDDFNYDYFSIGNTRVDRNNVISVSSPCILTISYSPIIKDSP